MTMSDPIADMLTRIRNANTAKHDTVDVPASKMKLAIADILLKEGYIKSYEKIVGKRMKRVYYHLTEEGQEELQKMMADYEKFENAANAIINFRRGQSEKSGQITEHQSHYCRDQYHE